LLLYSFYNNRLKEDNSLEIFIKSFDEEDPLLNYKIIKKSNDICRIDLRFGYIRLVVHPEIKKVLVEGFIDLDPRLKELDEIFVEILLKQFIIKFFSGLDKAKLDNKIEKNYVNDYSRDYYEFYKNELGKIKKSEALETAIDNNNNQLNIN
jgi:hypothetical protein